MTSLDNFSVVKGFYFATKVAKRKSFCVISWMPLMKFAKDEKVVSKIESIFYFFIQKIRIFLSDFSLIISVGH